MKDKLVLGVIVLWIFALLLFFANISRADTLVFEWDYDTDVDGFRLYQGMTIKSGSDWINEYDPIPIATISSEKRSLKRDIKGKPGIVQRYCYRIRAFKGDVESTDSNEVCVKIDNTTIDVPPVNNLRIRFEVLSIEE